MAQKDEILNKLSELAEEVTNAREQLLKGELVTIESVHQRIESECQRIVDLEPEDAAEIKPPLDNLLGDLRLFSEEIQYVQAKVVEILRDAEKSEADKSSSEPEA
ncbi:MAG: hypothetical protein GKS00_10745 [Alphaproteobacteria bacterium]|nr:hypothetical protein [Alphaproteobacteria bacterium]